MGQFYYFFDQTPVEFIPIEAYKLIKITDVETNIYITSDNLHFKVTAEEWFDLPRDLRIEGVKFNGDTETDVNIDEPSVIFLYDGKFCQAVGDEINEVEVNPIF